jgi:hypothetical protein
MAARIKNFLNFSGSARAWAAKIGRASEPVRVSHSLEPLATQQIVRAQNGPSSRYRRYAEECLALAGDARNPARKRLLLEMDAHWLDLAITLERHRPTEDLALRPPRKVLTRQTPHRR